jgi:hypothetical protein
MIDNEKFQKDLETLRLILIDLKIISENETIGVKQFVRYFQILRYSKNFDNNQAYKIRII